jgi:hypothetical protein
VAAACIGDKVKIREYLKPERLTFLKINTTPSGFISFLLFFYNNCTPAGLNGETDLKSRRADIIIASNNQDCHKPRRGDISKIYTTPSGFLSWQFISNHYKQQPPAFCFASTGNSLFAIAI